MSDRKRKTKAEEAKKEVVTPASKLAELPKKEEAKVEVKEEAKKEEPKVETKTEAPKAEVKKEEPKAEKQEAKDKEPVVYKPRGRGFNDSNR